MNRIDVMLMGRKIGSATRWEKVTYFGVEVFDFEPDRLFEYPLKACSSLHIEPYEGRLTGFDDKGEEVYCVVCGKGGYLNPVYLLNW